MDDSARLSLPFILAGQALKHITHNDALNRLDALVQPVVESATLTAPPAAALAGEAWLVPADASGAWAGHGLEIAAWQDGAWHFFDPAPGWQVFDRETGALKLFSGTQWTAVAAIGAGLPQLGINAAADDTNRLAVSGDATLLSHAGSDHRLTINKASESQSAGLLFQSNWSGRAEIGLLGDNHWRIKVSADGTSWIDAVTIDRADGALRLAGHLLPASDSTRTLGANGARWAAIWSASGTIQTSDRRSKTAIVPSDLGLDFILKLQPVRFSWREDDGRQHYGFVAQEVAEAVTRCGIRDFGGHVLSDPSDADSVQALRYDQFIAPLVAAIQVLAARVEVLEAAYSS